MDELDKLTKDGEKVYAGHVECEIKHSSDYYAKECVFEEIKLLQEYLKRLQFHIEHDRVIECCEMYLSQHSEHINDAIHELNRIKGLKDE